MSAFKKHDAIPVGDRENLPIEAILLAAGINIKNFLGAAELAIHEFAKLQEHFADA